MSVRQLGKNKIATGNSRCFLTFCNTLQGNYFVDAEVVAAKTQEKL